VIVARYDLAPTSARVLDEPTVVSRALRAPVITRSAYERTDDEMNVITRRSSESPERVNGTKWRSR
jgi:hypothetical protein